MQTTPPKDNKDKEKFGTNDQLWSQAVELAKQQSIPAITVSLIQRKLSIGYTRAYWLHEGLVASGLIKLKPQNKPMHPDELDDLYEPEESEESQEPMVSLAKVWIVLNELPLSADTWTITFSASVKTDLILNVKALLLLGRKLRLEVS